MLHTPIRPSDLPKTLGAYRAFRLLRYLGGGWISDVFEAELVESGNAACPARFALKVATNKSSTSAWRAELYKKHQIDEAYTHRLFRIEKEVYEAIDPAHPSFLRPLVDFCDPSLAEGHEICALPLGVGSALLLQQAFQLESENIHKIATLPYPAIRYLAVQMIEACMHLHDKGIAWNDLHMGNIIMMQDFTFKAADFGLDYGLGEEYDRKMIGLKLPVELASGMKYPDEPTQADYDHAIGYLLRKQVGDYPPGFVDFSLQLLRGTPLLEVRQHAWLRPPLHCREETCHGDAASEPQQEAELKILKRQAWESLSEAGRAYLTEHGVTLSENALPQQMTSDM